MNNIINFLIFLSEIIPCLIAIFSALGVIIAINPIHSILLLIIVFLCSAYILFMLQIQFLSLLLLLIYIGAIATLFIFVIMMLDIKISEEGYVNFLKYVPFNLFLGFIFLNELLWLWNKTKYINSSISNNFNNELEEMVWFEIFDYISDIKILGQMIYSYYFMYLIIGGLILLVAIIGSCMITLLCITSIKSQTINKQLSRGRQSLFIL